MATQDSFEPSAMSSENEIREIETKLALLDTDRAKLILQLNSLRSAEIANTPTRSVPPLLGRKALEQTPVTPEEKVSLFLKLFRCRNDIYPKRWENLKDKRHGYAPVCGNEWVKSVCQKPTIKCTACAFQKFLPLNEDAANAHLIGTKIIGTYAIREDDTCTFLAADFDKAAWVDDILAYQKTAREFGIDVAIERSRSGNGAHGWIFFEEPIPARIARSLGTLILAKCSEINIHLSLDSYDRLFPSQDYIPYGGFGNLIALPLQKIPRENGNSCFLNDKLIPFENQWEYLAQVRRLKLQEVTGILDQWIPKVTQIKKTDGFNDVIKILSKAGAKIIIRDERIAKRKVKAEFTGELKPVQQGALKAWKSIDIGILVAPPGSGKTVIGCAIIAQRKVSTLVLVHRQQILEQWKKSITQFLGIPTKEIGILSGTKKKLTGKIDVASMHSLRHIEDVIEIAQNYSQIIIEECHHVPAATFEDILKQIPARYILGLTATPYRKDGLEKILFQQCGPVKHEIKTADGGVLSKSVTIHETGFKTPEELGHRPPYQVLINYLVNDDSRNQKISKLTLELIQSEHFPLLVSDRKDHLDQLALEIKKQLEAQKQTLEIIRLDGDLTSKQRKLALDEIKVAYDAKKKLLLMSTGSLIGEGFDLPELDALILATPISFEGRMVQYAGRIHRLAEGKTKVQIIDFVDSYSAMLLKMYKNRIKAYLKMGYSIREPMGMFSGGRPLKRIQDTATPEFDFK